MKYTDVKLFDEVHIDTYQNERFTVVGIREKELELSGDWSAMYSIIQTDWYPIEKCRKVEETNVSKHLLA
jgi:hypothetical protein